MTVFIAFNSFAENKKSALIKRRDPFVSVVDKDGKIRPIEDLFKPVHEILPIDIELKGILFGGGQPRAVINDKILKEGSEVVEGLVLKKINVDNVIFEYRGQQVMIEIRKKEKK